MKYLITLILIVVVTITSQAQNRYYESFKEADLVVSEILGINYFITELKMMESKIEMQKFKLKKGKGSFNAILYSEFIKMYSSDHKKSTLDIEAGLDGGTGYLVQDCGQRGVPCKLRYVSKEKFELLFIM